MIGKKINISAVLGILSFFSMSFCGQTENCLENPFSEKVTIDISNYVANASESSVLKIANIFPPSCDEISKKQFQFKPRPYEKDWLFFFLYRYKQRLIYIQDMKNGDDWVFGWYFAEGKYVQYIEGRTLSILIRLAEKIDIHSNDVYQKLYKSLSGHLIFTSMGLFKDSDIKVVKEEKDYIEGYFTKTFKDLEKYKKDYIWTNGEYIVLEITKIRYPIADFKGPTYVPREIINGLLYDDKRSFKEYSRTGDTLDLEKEMLKVFPWIPDSLAAFKRDNILYGKTPVYILDSIPEKYLWKDE